MARITVTVEGEERTFPLNEHGLRVGRSPENAIVLNHVFVSRRHASFELRGHEAWLVDYESRNGVLLNRLRVREAQLADGDIVRIGPFDLRFEERAVQQVVLDDSRYLPLAAESREIKSGELPELGLELREFIRISKRLNSIISMGELLDTVMEEALQLVPAQRGVLMLYKGSELVPMVVYPPSQGDVALSSTIARRALDANEAVLTRDARLDFGGSESIISANIRSAICVPLISEGKATGLIYLDSPGRDQFSEAQRDMLSALVSQASTHIERARLSDELRHQAELRQNLERFMSPNVARLVASYYARHGQLWEPQELEVSVLFADVKGFTPLSEALSPREVQELLNEYLHEMTEVIFAHNGTLDKYIGDGIMAVFGAPRLNDDGQSGRYAVAAVNAALDMLEAHRRLNERHEPNKRFSFRIGINTGLAYAGFFGTRQRLEYTVLGDTVNTASRLESAAEPNSILVGEATCHAVGSAFAVQKMGELQLKGKARKVLAYKVLSRT